jgi:hypothetical protein
VKYYGETAFSTWRVVETKCFGHRGPCRIIRTWLQQPVHNHHKKSVSMNWVFLALRKKKSEKGFGAEAI